MIVLGISAYHGDASAALVADGRLRAAVEEERFARVKHCAGFPRLAARGCLEQARVAPGDVDWFAVSRDPRAHLLRKVWFALRNRPGRGLVRDRVRNAKRVRDIPTLLAETLGLEPAHVRRRTRWVEHHPAHLASAFFVSPFDEAAVCAIDGFGDFVSTSFARGKGTRIDVFKRIHFPHSLGLVYLAVTQYLGFRRYGDEFKVMGLAPYGKPRYVRELRRLLRLERGGGFSLDLSYFCHHIHGGQMTWDDGAPRIEPVFTGQLEALLGPARRPGDPVGETHEDIAASLQVVFEEAALHVLGGLAEATGLRRLCLAGGCAMNSVLNGKITEHTPFEEVYVQPASADNGTALGAAFHVLHQDSGHPRSFVMNHAYWGPEFEREAIARVVKRHDDELRRSGCTARGFRDEDKLCRWTAARIAEGKVVGWFQGRMEWGARALGNRSILADPRRPDMRDIINSKIKFREEFRPFAPSVREHALSRYFVGAVPDPFMVQVYPVRREKRAEIPAVTHVDGSGRVHTVSAAVNPRYDRLLQSFEELTGVPMLLNTSFNENEPIVHRPEEALACFLRTDMDVLVLGDCALAKPAIGIQLEAISFLASRDGTDKETKCEETT